MMAVFPFLAVICGGIDRGPHAGARDCFITLREGSR